MKVKILNSFGWKGGHSPGRKALGKLSPLLGIGEGGVHTKSIIS